jgi:hypothetical protein
MTFPKNRLADQHTILMIGSDTAVSKALSSRFARLGIKERVIIGEAHSSNRHSLKENSNQEYFWGEVTDPTTIILASQDVDGVMIDLSGLPQTLYMTPSELALNTLQESATGKPRWQGPQAYLSRVTKEVLGTYKDPIPTPDKHSSWSKPKGVNGEGQVRNSELTPLEIGLLSSPNSDVETSKPLTFLIPSIMVTPQTVSLFSDESLASYQLAGWSPNLIYYDWVTDHLTPTSEGEVVIPGELTGALSGILKQLINLKQSHINHFKALIEGQVSLKNLHQTLSLISTNDLVSAAVLIHKLQRGGERYLLRGDQLTWASLTQLCAHLIDILPPQSATAFSALMTNKSDSSTSIHHLINRLLVSLKGSGHSFKRSKRDPLEELNSTITSLIALSYGGANLSRKRDYFTPLPYEFTWTPVFELLEQEVDLLKTNLSG